MTGIPMELTQAEQLILEHNPAWTAADWPGVIPAMPSWAEDDFELVGMFRYDAEVPVSCFYPADEAASWRAWKAQG